MKKKTYAPNGVVIGTLLGLLIWAKTKSSVAGVVGAIIISIVLYIGIKALEDALGKGAAKAGDVLQREFDEKHQNTSNDVKMSTDAVYCQHCGTENPIGTNFCRSCGKEIS